MASAHEFFLSSTADAARAVVGKSLADQGFAVEATSAGGFVAKRGSVPMTVLFGGLAGRQLAMTFRVEIMELDGRIVARLSRITASAAVTGGAIGASKADTVFKATANTLGAALHDAGILTSSRQVG